MKEENKRGSSGVPKRNRESKRVQGREKFLEHKELPSGGSNQRKLREFQPKKPTPRSSKITKPTTTTNRTQLLLPSTQLLVAVVAESRLLPSSLYLTSKLPPIISSQISLSLRVERKHPKLSTRVASTIVVGLLLRSSLRLLGLILSNLWKRLLGLEN